MSYRKRHEPLFRKLFASMSNNDEKRTIDNPNKSSELIEDAITKYCFKRYDYKDFRNAKKIGSGVFGKVYRVNWKDSQRYLVLKSFFDLNKETVKEIVHEFKLQREVDFHENIIRYYGITVSNDEHESDNQKQYFFVFEYADGGSLKSYLRERFSTLSWNDKLNLALQLAYAVSCSHEEGILHRDLHSNNVLVRQNTIKLGDFGLFNRIKEASKLQTKLFGVIPYVDPKSFSRQRNDNNRVLRTYSLNRKSDVYSVGVLLWEITSGRPPFNDEQYDIGLALEILQGLREKTIPDTPDDYVKIYTDCWDGEPTNRPTINQVVARLKVIIERK